MSEFVDPIKNVKKKVKLLDEASKVIKSSLRQQLERQREIKGLEVAKTEEYAKQAKPIVEAVGTQPSEEEKKLAKENDRNIVISNLDLNKIPITDPSYNIILRYFDDSYDTIKNRKTDALKQRDINMMVSSIDSLLTVNVFGIPTPIGKLSKKIFEKIFLNKDFEITPEETKDIETHEQEIKDREKTQAERIEAEAEMKIEEEKKAIEEETKKREAEKSEEELKRIEFQNKSSQGLKNTMYAVYKDRIKEQGLNYDSYKKSLDIGFNFIHPTIITDTNQKLRKFKIEGLIDRLKDEIPKEYVRKRIKNALIRTYTNAVVDYSSSKLATDPTFTKELGILLGRKREVPVEEEKAPVEEEKAPVEPPRPVRAISDEGFEDALPAEPPPPMVKKKSIPPAGPPPEKARPVIPKGEAEGKAPAEAEGKAPAEDEEGILFPDFIDDKVKESNIQFENEYGKKLKPIPTDESKKPIPNPIKIEEYFRKNRDNIAKSGGKAYLIFKPFTNSVKEVINSSDYATKWSEEDRAYFQIIATEKLIDLKNKEPDTAERNKFLEKAKNFQIYSLSKFPDSSRDYKRKAQQQMKSIYGGKGLKNLKKQKGGFNFLSMFAPIPLVGNGQLTMEDLRTKTSSGIKKKLGLTKPEVLLGKGMTILNPKNFQKGMKKKANEDLLHNLQVHMAQVQAGNNNLKQPISMLVDEAVGRGIMKKQVGNKIKKHFVN